MAEQIVNQISSYILLAVVVLYASYRAFSWLKVWLHDHINYRQQQLGRLSEITVAITRLTGQMELLNEGNVLVSGMAKIAEAEVAEIIKLRQAVAHFTDVVAPRAGSDGDVLENYDESVADRMFAKHELMHNEGISGEEAETRVELEESVSSVSL